MLQHLMQQRAASRAAPAPGRAGARPVVAAVAAAVPAPPPPSSARARQCRRRRRVTPTTPIMAAFTTTTSSSNPNKQQQQQQAPLPPPPSASGRQLVDPAHLCVRASARAAVAKAPLNPPNPNPSEQEDTSLDAYMRLPVEQYYCLDPSSIAFLGGDRFRLSVGKVALPRALGGLWVEPTVEVKVRAAAVDGGDSEGGDGAVVLEAERCFLRASPALEALKLDEKFALRFKARLTWSEEAERSGAAATQGGNGGGEIRGDATVDVYSEVLAPFRLVPRPALEAACSGVLASLARALLPLFLRQLADDYLKWASDASYRAARRARGLKAGGGGQSAGARTAVQQPVRERVAVR